MQIQGEKIDWKALLGKYKSCNDCKRYTSLIIMKTTLFYWCILIASYHAGKMQKRDVLIVYDEMQLCINFQTGLKMVS